MLSIRPALRRIARCFAASGRMMLRHEVPRDAAGISYFSVVALFPAILIMMVLIDTSLGWISLHETFIEKIVALFPGSRQFLSANVEEITAPSTAVALCCIAVVLWSASWIFTFMESAINRAWEVPSQRTFLAKPNARRGFRSIDRRQLADFGCHHSVCKQCASSRGSAPSEVRGGKLIHRLVLVLHPFWCRAPDCHPRFRAHFQMDPAFAGSLARSFCGRRGNHHPVGDRQRYIYEACALFRLPENLWQDGSGNCPTGLDIHLQSHNAFRRQFIRPSAPHEHGRAHSVFRPPSAGRVPMALLTQLTP